MKYILVALCVAGLVGCKAAPKPKRVVVKLEYADSYCVNVQYEKSEPAKTLGCGLDIQTAVWVRHQEAERLGVDR